MHTILVIILWRNNDNISPILPVKSRLNTKGWGKSVKLGWVDTSRIHADATLLAFLHCRLIYVVLYDAREREQCVTISMFKFSISGCALQYRGTSYIPTQYSAASTVTLSSLKLFFCMF